MAVQQSRFIVSILLRGKYLGQTTRGHPQELLNLRIANPCNAPASDLGNLDMRLGVLLVDRFLGRYFHVCSAGGGAGGGGGAFFAALGTGAFAPTDALTSSGE